VIVTANDVIDYSSHLWEARGSVCQRVRTRAEEVQPSLAMRSGAKL
jgi:hypothetical protein